MYNDRGELEVSVVCDECNGERLKEEILDATRGGVMFRLRGDAVGGLQCFVGCGWWSRCCFVVVVRL